MMSSICYSEAADTTPKSAASSLRRKREGKLLGKQMMISELATSQKYERSMNYSSDYELRNDEKTNTNVNNESSLSMS